MNQYQDPFLFRTEARIHTYLAGPDRLLSLTGLFNIFQDAAHTQAGLLGWGYRQLAGMNRLWALLRVRVIIERMPEWDTQVVMETWPKGMKNLFASRDFMLMDPEGNLLVRGTSLWAVLDADTRRPVKPDLGENVPDGDWRNAIEAVPSKIAWPGELTRVRSIRVGYNHLDMNRHVNNTRYLEWAQNEFDAEVMDQRRPGEAEINFLNEVVHDEELEVLRPVSGFLAPVQSAYIRKAADQLPVYALTVKYR